MTHVACESKLRWTVWQSGVRSCIMPGVPKHLVQEFTIEFESHRDILVRDMYKIPSSETRYWRFHFMLLFLIDYIGIYFVDKIGLHFYFISLTG